MTILDDGRDRLGGALTAGRARIGGMLSGVRARAGEVRDERRRRALIVDLGKLCYDQQTGSENPQLEADLDAVVAELQHMEALAELRQAGRASANGHTAAEPDRSGEPPIPSPDRNIPTPARSPS